MLDEFTGKASAASVTKEDSVVIPEGDRTNPTIEIRSVSQGPPPLWWHAR